MQFKTKKIKYADAYLELPDFLADIWTLERQLDDWPDYCGAGEGFGNWIVPDKICGVRVACCCFDHDISWAVSDNTWPAMMSANMRFYSNIRALVLANSTASKWSIEARCFAYFAAVSAPHIGRKFFKSCGEDRIEVTDPFDHPIVVRKLKLLEKKHMGYRAYAADNG